jgi:hypothetical protein
LTFINIRDTCKLIAEIAQGTSSVDREIIIHLAAAQQQGECLTMKQLVLTRLGTATTVRRRIALLMVSGYVIKVAHRQDKRLNCYQISPAFYRQLNGLTTGIRRIWDSELEQVARKSGDGNRING